MLETFVIASVATVTLAVADPDLVVSSVLVAVTVTGLGLGTALGAV